MNKNRNLIVQALMLLVIMITAFALFACSSNDTASTAPETETKSTDDIAFNIDAPSLKDPNRELHGKTSDKKLANMGSLEGRSKTTAKVDLAKAGDDLVELENLPSRTFQTLELGTNTLNARYDATIEAYGIKTKALDGTPQELIVRINEWAPKSDAAAQELNMKGRNAVIRVEATPEEAAKLAIAGVHKVELKVSKVGDKGMLAIDKVK